jgi:hypothetical protein
MDHPSTPRNPRSGGATAEQLSPRALAQSRRAAMRLRARRIRRSVAGLTIGIFVAAFLAVYVQLASGHDPALSTSSKRRSTTSGTLLAAKKADASKASASKATSGSSGTSTGGASTTRSSSSSESGSTESSSSGTASGESSSTESGATESGASESSSVESSSTETSSPSAVTTSQS